MDQLSPETQSSINEAIAANRKILAIKLYRNATKADLKSAKAFVESQLAGGSGQALAESAHEFPGVSEDEAGEILDAIFANRKLLAIKQYKSASGHSLKESKEFIESLTGQLQREYPEQFRLEPESKLGCGSAVLAIAIGGTLLASILRSMTTT